MEKNRLSRTCYWLSFLPSDKDTALLILIQRWIDRKPMSVNRSVAHIIWTLLLITVTLEKHRGNKGGLSTLELNPKQVKTGEDMTLKEWKHIERAPHLVGISSEAFSICLMNWKWSSSRRLLSYWVDNLKDRERTARGAGNWGNMREEKATVKKALNLQINLSQNFNWPLSHTCAE